MQNHVSPQPIPLSTIKGVGPAIARKLNALGIFSATDLLFHLPLRYQDRTTVQSIGSLQSSHAVVIEGEVTACNIIFGKRRSLVCKIKDQSGVLTLRFFHFSAAQKKQMVNGQLLRCFGEVNINRGSAEMIHPEYQRINAGDPLPNPTHLTAIYPTVDGISQIRWRNYIEGAFAVSNNASVETLIDNEKISAIKQTLAADLFSSLKLLHYPPATIDLALISTGMHPLQRQLAFEELVAQRLSHLLLRKTSLTTPAIAIEPNAGIEETFLSRLAFTLTGAQQRVLQQIKNDIAKPQPMMRLLQGDVGSGKTIVAATAALQFISQHQQVVIMAPTEILAEQHLETFTAWFANLNIRTGLLVSKIPAAEKRQRLASIANGEMQIIIGTHALIQEQVNYQNLGLIVIDEQHRFGVDQRRKLKDKRLDHFGVHQLVMTATPIPRTLAMTFYADLDYSVIDELPPGRSPIETVALSNDRRGAVIDRVNNACQQGRQVYWVCTLIEESEQLDCQAAETTANELVTLLPNITVGLIHGRLKPAQKQIIMQHFNAGDIQLLVSTTVVEVGVNVPNASLMIIENPERLGLSQLHQLRGRVGRGEIQSHCVLMYQKPLSKNGKQRIDIMRATNDGFVLAQKDLEMRGPGQVLGTRQSGASLFKMADLERDSDLIPDVVAYSDAVIDQNPSMANKLIERWCPLASNYIDV